MGRKEHKPLEVSDLKPCEFDGQLTDSYGNVVKHGSRIVIEGTYNGLESRDNFYGVYKFRVKQNEKHEIKENGNEQIQTNENKTIREVPLESFNQSA